MKKGHIFALVLAAVALSLVISTFKGASRYVNFAEAKQLSTSGTLKEEQRANTLEEHK